MIEVLVLDDASVMLDGVGFVEALRNGENPEGCEVEEQERQTPDDVPIVMVTTEVASDRVQDSLLAGANGSLSKPFTADQLCERIAMFL